MTTQLHPRGYWTTTATLRCHAGKVRSTNQDRVGHAQGAGGEIYVVADGVGGEAGGGEAATIAVEIFEQLATRPPKAPAISPAEAMQQAVKRIGEHIHAERLAQPAFRAMASTIAAVYLSGPAITIGHIGDSRIYLCRSGVVQALTRDHSVVERMVAEGILTEEEASNHPKAHILTRSLGQPDVALETVDFDGQPGDMLLLCSDGLWSYVPSQVLHEALAQPDAETEALADALLQLALDAGAPDNVSVIVVLLASFEESANLLDSESAASPAKPERPWWKRWTFS